MTENEQMLAAILNCKRSDLVLDPKTLSPEQGQRLQRMQLRRSQGEPLQYILGDCNFMGLLLKVDPRVLIPRPETEILVDTLLKHVTDRTQNLKILDLGTGSGNIAIAIAKHLPRATVVSVDASAPALELAHANAKNLGLDSQIEFIHSDMVKFMKERADSFEEFDVIVSNPPYIPTAQLPQLPLDVQKEPRLALDGGEDGLKFLKSILKNGPQLLTSNGFVICEIGDGQRKDLETFLKKLGCYASITFEKDYTQTDRIVIAR